MDQSLIAVDLQGRRGLLNLGQTCFLNVVLQSFVHNPLLRNYFLSDKHNKKLCKLTDCTCCEMDVLFAEVNQSIPHPKHISLIIAQIYSTNVSPHGPTSFLHTTWRASHELSGYSQQDAHEFFISALNQIHTTSKGSTNVSCNCIIHSTFAGQLQSDVKCERCGNVTSTVDPMLDISLELKGKTGELVNGENTLAACLRRSVYQPSLRRDLRVSFGWVLSRYTQPEKLGAKEYSCSKCTGNKSSHSSVSSFICL